MSESQVIPPPDDIREQIRARVAEVRALRQMLRLAIAASEASEARAKQRPLNSLTAKRRRQIDAS